jgi:hypothetical protein
MINRRSAGTQPIPAALISAVCLLAACKAGAMPLVISDDIRGMWNSTIVAGAAIRAKDPDKQLVGANNAPEYPGAKGAGSVNDDGNLNFSKGDVIGAPIVYTTDLELRYRKRYGVYGKGRAWYDPVGESSNVPHGSIANGYVPDEKLDDSDYYSHNKFSGSQLLDLYTYANWDIGASRLSGRYGRQSINWGESLLHTGINAFNPLNFSALGRPRIGQDDALLPVNRVYSNFITRNGISLEAFYNLDWEESHLPPCGTFAQIVDLIADPGCFAATSATPLTDQQQFDFHSPEGNPLLTPAPQSSKPGNGGQYGLSTRYFVEPLNTEFGLYYVNYHATLPTLAVNLCQNGWEGCSSLDGLSLPLTFHEDVKAYAISAATGVRNIALSAELSHFHDLPVQRNFPELIAGATRNQGIYADRMSNAGNGAQFSGAWKADRTQLLLGGVMDLTSTIGLANATLVAEVSSQWVNNLPGDDEERIGRPGVWGNAIANGEPCESATQKTEGGCKVDGFATDFSWGYRLLVSMSLPRPARGIDLIPLISWRHDVEGYAVDGSQVEGRSAITFRMRAVFQRAFFLDLTRTWNNSTNDYDILRDKDIYSIALGVSF